MLHDATYTQLKVQHNLQPRSLRIFLFLCKCCPFFLGWSFQIRFSVAIYFWHPFSKFFFWWQPTLATVLLILYYLAFLHLFGGKQVCVCVCVWLTPYFPDAVLHWPLPDVILRVSYYFDILGLLLHLLFHFLKRPGWFSWRSMTLSTGLWFDNLLRGFDFLGLWFRWLGLVDAVLFLLEVHGVVVRSFLLLVF